jgi:flagellar biosynthesis/type III secretory pathway protein FliH
MSAPDISAEAVERLARALDATGRYTIDQLIGMEAESAAATLRALRAALDAAERERDEAHKQGYCEGYEDGEKAADATGYARGVRDAADAAKAERITEATAHAHLIQTDPEWVEGYNSGLSDLEAAILALLPATDETKETRDDQ